MADKEKDAWKDKNAVCKRVFRTTVEPFYNDKRIIYTCNLGERLESGTTMPAVVIKKRPNHAGQYVLSDNEQEYTRQLAALRREETKGTLVEMAPEWEGKPFIPQPPPDEKDKKIAELEAKLASFENDKTFDNTRKKANIA